MFVMSVNPDGSDYRQVEMPYSFGSGYGTFNRNIVLGPDNRWYGVLQRDLAKKIRTPALVAMSPAGGLEVIGELSKDMLSTAGLYFGPEGRVFGIGGRNPIKMGLFVLDPLHQRIAPPERVVKTIENEIKQMTTIDMPRE